MKDHYVSFEQAVKLKELGFDWKCDHFYYIMIRQLCDWTTYSADDYNTRKEKASAPRIDQAQAWLREVKGIHISVNPYMDFDIDADGELYNEFPLWAFELMDVASAEFMNEADGKYESYESALSAGIDKALELLGKEEKV